MAKSQSVYICQSCGSQHGKWMGQCNKCGEWNTIIEEIVQKKAPRDTWKAPVRDTSKPVLLEEVSFKEEERLITHDGELDRVLGGGLVPGSLVLLGGEPGIGKSTLMLQLSQRIKNKVLYVSGEESDKQIKMRADRLSDKNPQNYVLTETHTQKIFKHINELTPEVVIIDSIQTLHTDSIEAMPGSISQIRECAAELLTFAKRTSTPVILIGHINKDGQLAGPKVLEHMVDVVLQFEGDQHHIYRLLRAHKNRFGSTAELGIYEMNSKGLREVLNPSEILLSKKDEALSGISVAAMLEGMRPMLIEIQALVSTAVYGTPQRSCTGFDARRLNMLLAVLEKRCGFRLGSKDVFLNITGGIKVDDPAIDLAVVSAILSSNEDITVNDKACFAGEVGLAGEIRAVNRIEQRILEAEKLGFEEIYISKYNKITPGRYAIQVHLVGKIEDLVSEVFG